MDASDKLLIIFRGNRLDNMWAAAIVAMWTNGGFEIARIASGDSLPDVTGRDVYLINTVLDKSDIIRLLQTARSALFVGNSAKAMSNLEEHDTTKAITVITDPEQSVTSLVWSKLFARPKPVVLDYLNEYYFGLAKLPKANIMMAALRHEPSTLANVERLLALDEAGVEALLAIGKVAYDAHNRACNSIIKTSLRYATVHGHLVPVCNSPAHCATEISYMIIGTYPFSVVYYDTARGRRFELRNRVRGGVDLASIAAMYGGDGGEVSAGFTVPLGHPFALK